MSVVIENDILRVNINEHGAQITSLYNKKNDIEYIWTADEKYWLWHAPILFPIEGKLKDGICKIDGKAYHISQHGFARDNDFKVIEYNNDDVTLCLTENVETLKVFPFKFKLLVTYKLETNSLKTIYKVINTDIKNIYFTIGSHPGFNIPLTKNGKFDDYEVDFSSKYETLSLDSDGFVDENNPIKHDNTPLHISRSDFKNDALIYRFKDKMVKIGLHNSDASHGIQLSSNNAKFWGIWSTYPKDSHFICIEPWWGITDTIDTDQNFKHKFANNKLAPSEKYIASYSMKAY